MDMNKWTCRCAEHVRVEGAVEGTREEVLGWMKSRFPGLRETDECQVEQWYCDYKGGVKQYEIDRKDEAVSGSQYLYLVEKIGDDNKESALQVLAEFNELSAKIPWTKVVKDSLDLAFLDKIRSLGWTVSTENFYERDGERYAQYRLSDPDSAEAMESAPLAACLGEYANQKIAM